MVTKILRNKHKTQNIPQSKAINFDLSQNFTSVFRYSFLNVSLLTMSATEFKLTNMHIVKMFLESFMFI